MEEWDVLVVSYDPPAALIDNHPDMLAGDGFTVTVEHVENTEMSEPRDAAIVRFDNGITVLVRMTSGIDSRHNVTVEAYGPDVSVSAYSSITYPAEQLNSPRGRAEFHRR